MPDLSALRLSDQRPTLTPAATDARKRGLTLVKQEVDSVVEHALDVAFMLERITDDALRKKVDMLLKQAGTSLPEVVVRQRLKGLENSGFSVDESRGLSEAGVRALYLGSTYSSKLSLIHI